MVFRNETQLLKTNGIDVITFEKYNDNITKNANGITSALNTIWSKDTYNELKAIIQKEKPDIAHFHNIWYLLSPSAFYACKEEGIPVVQTLHNFRLFCANGLLLRRGQVCEECVGKLPWKAIVYGCYRNSRFYSMPVALTEGIHRIKGTWENKVDAYIALTEFGRNKFIEHGLPPDKITVKPNFILNSHQSHSLLEGKPAFTNENYIVFLGRLSNEKGVITLINAFKILKDTVNKNTMLKIVGDGPLKTQIEDMMKTDGISDVELTGRKTHSECMEILGKARFMVIPSIWYETFPLTALESFSCGKAVIASRLGALAEIVQDQKTGLLFEPGNPEDLALKMKWMIENEDACIEMGRNARKEFESKYTAEKNFEMLMGIYDRVVRRWEDGKVGGWM
mgnify:CR=1 FL=1